MTADVRRTAVAMRVVLLGGGLLVLVAGWQLFVLSERTDRFFAWTIASPLTAAFLGSFYWAAAVLAVASGRQREWARARVGVPGVSVFVVATALTTLLHVDRFHTDASGALTLFATYGWITVYAAAPVALAVAIAAQLRVPGADPPRAAPVPAPLAAVLAVQALLALGFGLALFVVPDAVARVWPWALTPLTARASAAWLLGLGVVIATALVERDAARLRHAGTAYAVLAVLLAVALVRYGREVDWTPGGAVYAASLAVAFATGLAGAAWTRRSDPGRLRPATAR